MKLSAPRVLLASCSGAEHSGAEARLLATIEDFRALPGPPAVNTSPMLNAAGRVLDGSIAAVNAQPAEPERFRRWAGAGAAPEELASNQKLKRAVVARRYHDVIESLYGAAAPQGRL